MSERKTTVADIMRTCETAAFRMALQPEDRLAGHVRRILAVLAGKRFPLEDEKQTQASIDAAMRTAGLVVDREVPGPGGIIDFVVTLDEPSGVLRSMRFVHIGIEVKLKGQPAAIKRQLERYASDDMLAALILVTAKPVAMPAALGGKPLAVLDLGRAWL